MRWVSGGVSFPFGEHGRNRNRQRYGFNHGFFGGAGFRPCTGVLLIAVEIDGQAGLNNWCN